MNRVEKIEGEVQELTSEELASFRAWFAEYDWEAWDRQLAQDSAQGKLDHLADEASSEHEAGRTKAL